MSLSYDKEKIKKMIHIITGYGDMGGSTVAFISLVNLLNKHGYQTILHTPNGHSWALDQCNSKQIEGGFSADYFGTSRQPQLVLKDNNILDQILKDGDTLICHLLPLDSEHIDTSRLKKVIYACHETDVYRVDNINPSKFDLIHYVSEFQRDWHNYTKVPNVVIPNIVTPIEKQKKTLDYEKVGGVIGAVNPVKRTHVAIQAALDDGCDKVLVFGLRDPNHSEYWDDKVSPVVQDPKVLYLDSCDDKSLMYSDLDVVYHSCRRETFNYVEKECAMLKIPFVHTDDVNKEKEPITLVSDTEIMKMWEEVLK